MSQLMRHDQTKFGLVMLTKSQSCNRNEDGIVQIVEHSNSVLDV